MKTQSRLPPMPPPLDDALAKHLELKGFWRRAADRWLVLLIQECNARRAEALTLRRRHCLKQALAARGKYTTVNLSLHDLHHLATRARELGCGSVSKYWIDYRD